MIDAGNPAWPVASEPLPNGNRINIGAYAGSEFASLSPTNAALIAVSYNSGGAARGTNVLLYWVAQGAATGHTLSVQVSVDAGLSWTNLVTGLAPGTSSFTWNTTNVLSTPLALWRVSSEVETNVADQVNTNFSIRNTNIIYYVNDNSTNGDVYCTAIGNNTNNAISPSSPRNSIKAVLDTYDLDDGDIIYVDTGYYVITNEIAITQLDAGNRTNGQYLVVQGSTNYNSTGTVIEQSGAGNVFNISDYGGVSLRDLHLRGGEVGVFIFRSRGVEVQGLDIRGATNGISVGTSSRVNINNTLVRESSLDGIRGVASTDLRVSQSLLWSNAQYGVSLISGEMAVSNSIFCTFGSRSYAYNVSSVDATLVSDYNNFYINGFSRLGRVDLFSETVPALEYENVARWTRDQHYDAHSLSHDPLFVDAAAGDFHLQSQAGRYNPATGTFVLDAQTSPLIDAGSPFAALPRSPLRMAAAPTSAFMVTPSRPAARPRPAIWRSFR
jgi:hypothetical protein